MNGCPWNRRRRLASGQSSGRTGKALVARAARTVILCLPLASAIPAAAEASGAAQVTLPPGATAMIETAVRSNDETEIRTVVRIAKKTWPDSAAAIDAFVETTRKQEQAARYQRIEEGNLLTEWHGEIRLGGSTATGNSSRTTTTVGLEVGRDGPDWRHTAEMELFYSFSGGDDPTKRINAFWQSDYKLSDNRFLYGRLSYLKNFSAGIRDRVVESVGYGARFERAEHLDGHVNVGAAARQARYYDGDFRTDAAVRVGSRVNWDIWRGVRLSNVNTLYITRDATIDNTISLRTSIIDGLSVIFSFNLQWEDEPAVGFEPLSTLTSITIGFGF